MSLCKRNAFWCRMMETAIRLMCSDYTADISGGEIEEHGNANKVVVLGLVHAEPTVWCTAELDTGGIKDNAIPREASAAFVCQADLETVAACVQEMKTIFAKELEFSDAGVDVAVKEVACDGVLCIEDSEEVITLLMTLPNGLRHHSMSIEGLSTASSNIGVVTNARGGNHHQRFLTRSYGILCGYTGDGDGCTCGGIRLSQRA